MLKGWNGVWVGSPQGEGGIVKEGQARIVIAVNHQKPITSAPRKLGQKFGRGKAKGDGCMLVEIKEDFLT